MDFDPRHEGMKRRGADIEKHGRRGADQNQLVGQRGPRHLAGHNVPGGEGLLRLPRPIAHPKASLGIGRHGGESFRDLDLPDAVFVREDAIVIRIRDNDPQELKNQTGQHLALDIEDHGHAAHDAVTLGPERNHTHRQSGAFQLRDVAQHVGVTQKEGFGVGTHGRIGRAFDGFEVSAQPARRRGLGQHHRTVAQSFGEDLVIARQLLELLAHRIVQIPEVVGIKPRRHTVGLGKDNVQGNRRRAVGGDFLDQLGHGHARPGPLPDVFQGGFVQVHDNDRVGGDGPRFEPLIKVECLDADRFDHTGVEGAQDEEGRQQQQSDPAPAAEPVQATPRHVLQPGR